MAQEQDAGGGVAERYGRFARDEAPGRSALYAEWAAGVAADPTVQAALARIPPDRRQPPLVFAVTRLLGASEEPYALWRVWLLDHVDAVMAECGRRRVQTNEPQRCAALLPALSLVRGPIALLEVGASAGLCLYPDRYSYRYTSDDGSQRELDPRDGASRVVLSSALRGAVRPELRMPQIVWRAGIDVQPLDAGDADDRAFLIGLVWPGERGRAERVAAALDVVAAERPVIHRGDAADLLPAVAASAPRDATLVVTTPGVLAHVPRGVRARLITAAREAGRWITLDEPAVHDAWSPPIGPTGWPAGGFALALDGRVLASADPLGGFVEWRAEDATTRR